MRITLSGLLLLFSSWILSGQPVITCLDVRDSGDVEINWLPYNGSGFEEYKIFHSSDNLTYTEIFSTTNEYITNYIHTGASADVSSQYYQLKVYFSGDSLSSLVQQTIFLFLDSSQPDVAKLSWNPPNGLQGNKYKIWRKYTHGNWTEIVAEHSGTFYNEVIADGICATYIEYEVELITPYNCTYGSNYKGGFFTEANYPDNPVFDSVSINYFNDTPHIVLGWHASQSEDVAAYIIYRKIGSAFMDVDTVYGINNTFYVDTTVAACDTVYSYAIASMDSCGNKSPGTFSSPKSNIRLIDVAYNPCKLEAVITFEPFVDLEGDSIHFDLIGNSSLGNENTNVMYTQSVIYKPEINKDLQYITVVDEDLRVGRLYSYFIRETVYKNGTYYTTSSCIKTIYAYNYDKPSYIYFANADVLPNNQIDLTIDYDTAVKNSSLAIWRSEPGENDLYYLKTIHVNTLTERPVRLTDTSADGSKGFYKYKVKVMDSCGHKWIESNELKTIHLGVNILDKNHNLLQWNLFKGWDSGVAQYYIYRMENNVEPLAPIDSVWRSFTEYTDDISAIAGSVESLVYWVQAVERRVNDFGFKEKSNSNRTIVTPESDIYFPNAFKPGGTESVFKPVFRFLGGTNYLFQIYNRWGQLIFETTDKLAGWDGTYKGAYVQQGVYIYKFQYRDVFGNSVNRQGTVTVIY